MILHCSQKLADKLRDVSPTPLAETSLLGSWHGHLVPFDRRQCLLFCHDETRYIFFLPGVKKEHLAKIEKLFRELFFATLISSGRTDLEIKKASSALGPMCFDTTTDRSVQGTLRVAKLDLEAWVYGVHNVMDLDPVATSCKLNERPSTVRGKWIWPDKEMMKRISKL